MASDAVKLLEGGAIIARRYRVVRCIKSGGMGAVYEVTDVNTKRRLALKTVRPGIAPTASLRARFEQETSITASIDSEHIVKVEDAGVDDESGMAFLTMELLVGLDLDAVLKESGPLQPDRVAKLLWQVALALAAVHDAGIVHRDLKPENLFLTLRDTGEELVKILDFGVAKLIDTDRKTTAFVGTPLYMPPEQIRGEHPDPRADTFALAQVAFALLSGHAYLEPGNVKESATRRAKRHGVSLPKEFDAWFERATAYDVAKRFETAIELVEALGSVLGVELPGTTVRAARVAPAVRPAAAPVGVPTAAASHDGSKSGSVASGDSIGGVSSGRQRRLGANWRRLAATAAAGAVGAAGVLGVIQWRSAGDASATGDSVAAQAVRPSAAGPGIATAAMPPSPSSAHAGTETTVMNPLAPATTATTAIAGAALTATAAATTATSHAELRRTKPRAAATASQRMPEAPPPDDDFLSQH